MIDEQKNTLKLGAIWASVLFVSITCVVALFVGAEFGYSRLYENRIYPGTRVYGVRVNGLTREEARETVQKQIDTELVHGFRFVFVGQEVQLQSTLLSTDPDASRDLIRYDVEHAVDDAYAIGRNRSWLQNAVTQLAVRVRGANVVGNIFLDEAVLHDSLLVAYEEKLKPPQDASFSYVIDSAGVPFIHIENERSGYILEIGDALETLRSQAEALNFQPIALRETRSEPSIFRVDLEPILPEVELFLQRPALTFTYSGKSYVFGPAEFSGWIVPRRGEDGVMHIAFDEARFAESIHTRIPDLEKEVVNGNLVIKDGVIDSFTPGQNGNTLNASSTLATVWGEWPEKTTFSIDTEVILASLLGDDPERLGIREIIGVGTSNFAGSPQNRRKNIALGVEKVNGTIIPPGEEFSLLKTLGPVDGAHGWLTELVIKGNKTIPEFGGGLCQIGTTVFRGTMDSGLKIIERQNHSYRVSYYEPAGTDATIYEPAPDYRFLNDTGNYILINGYIRGDEVVFEFWGTSDGRTVEPRTPIIYNITPPPPMKLIETLDLPPGKKKCTESAHAGADASLKYIVNYKDGTTFEEEFISHYRPWQAVCLVGVEELSVNATSTGLGE
ncbi:MAG: VanW family protein [bacterium]|nr:VanW family protein [bacterium]